MKSHTPTLIERKRTQYKSYQDRVAAFGVPAAEFNTKVKDFLRKPTPTPVEWVFGAWQVTETITSGRCCPKAVCIPCVCEVSYKCEDHGVRCKGSHD
jgi:hypothetical protein